MENYPSEQKRRAPRNPQERFESIVRQIEFKASRDAVPKTTLQLKVEKSSQDKQLK